MRQWRKTVSGIIGLGIVLAFGAPASAQLVTKDVEYRDGKTVLHGYLAYDESIPAPRAAVLVFHEWDGLDSYEKKRADQLAGLGYVAFCADIYGQGIRPKNDKEAARQAGIYRSDVALMRRRAAAALRELRKQAMVDPARIAAIGYCFGGGVALELARSGADIDGAVSFHGNLDTPAPEDDGNIRAKVLVLHGSNDPVTPPDKLLAFERAMSAAKVDWQVNTYGGAVHRFTNPAAGTDPSGGYAYDANADRRSWEAMKLFFIEIF